MWDIYFTQQAQQDAKKIAHSNLKSKVQNLLEIIRTDPFAYPPKFEMLRGELKGFISRRINKQHRLVYQVFEEENAIKILKMWTHYE
ncbi:MAG: Txe/YoeB family addiction module toxin [Ignavibacteria bacterium]|nr:Txe/YoeB family addiction module toxin [Ignavibacteria bacterium]